MNQSAIIDAPRLRDASERLAAAYPAVLARAEHLAAAISLGGHGRRRAGQGEDFWQYRQAMPGDSARSIDWRRSARSDSDFVRQLEWQSAQTVHFWVDDGAGMEFSSEETLETKGARARVLSLALAILLNKAGERVGLMKDAEPPAQGRAQIEKMALQLMDLADQPDYASAPNKPMGRSTRAVFMSDFLADWDGIVTTLSRAADQNVQGLMVQITDPQEEEFPFKGRTLFHSSKGERSFESLRAKALREEYLERFAERQDALSHLAQSTGWRFLHHRTDTSAQSALLWLYQAIGGMTT